MPKVSSHIPAAASASAPYSNTNLPNVLKRNQACHQCRRRKLKCDAKRPCSTCSRSHAHAVAHAPAGTQPPTPECTFDDLVEPSLPVTEAPKNRYERLENRISELEALLRQKDGIAAATAPDTHAYLPGAQPQSPGQSLLTPPSHDNNSQDLLPSQYSVTENLADVTRIFDPHIVNSYMPARGSPALLGATSPVSNPSPSHRLDIQWPNWPVDLPEPTLLRHLVEVFFVFHPHADRLFHAPSFMTTLSLPPTHPKFPVVPILHAICAIGSLYTAVVSSPPLPDFAKVEPDEIFPQKYRVKESRPDSFAEKHAKLAKETAENLEFLGENLLQVLQARLILSWFYWSHSRWVEVFTSSAHSLRVAVPLGLNVCPPFHSIARSHRPPSILPPARTVIEDETRRNVFWLAYATERQHGSGNGWCLSMDDMDISQLMPVRGDQFERGVLVTPHERQWAHSKELLLIHPESQTDSFILYIKGTILMSRVKVFNHRFRARHFAGDAAVSCVQTQCDDESSPDKVDPRGSPAFMELDHLVSSFRGTFPSHLRNPIVDNVVDNHLYTACLMPLVATIVLHDPHADVRQSGCISALKILTAARGILDMMYNVWSTSYDITLLDSFCTFCWFSAGRVLVRFLQSAVAAGSEDQISTLRAEVEFVRLAIEKFGERIPLAYRFAKMLADLIAQCHGPASTSLSGAELLMPVIQPGGIGTMSYDPGRSVNIEDLMQSQ